MENSKALKLDIETAVEWYNSKDRALCEIAKTIYTQDEIKEWIEDNPSYDTITREYRNSRKDKYGTLITYYYRSGKNKLSWQEDMDFCLKNIANITNSEKWDHEKCPVKYCIGYDVNNKKYRVIEHRGDNYTLGTVYFASRSLAFQALRTLRLRNYEKE